MTPDHDLPRVRALALGAVALVVVAAGAVTGPARVPVLATVAVVLVGVGAWRWRRAGRTGVSTSAVVAGVLVGLLLADEVDASVDVVLLVTGLVALASGWVLRERRLAVSGLLTLGVMVGRPLPGGETISHCLVATELAVPVPRLAGPLWLAAAAVVVGTALRWSGLGVRWRRVSVARGVEATGAAGVAVLLLARGAELPDHRLLCGAGDGLDAGWLLLAVAWGVVTGVYGLAGRDVVWEGVGLGTITGAGVLGTTLSGSPWWAVGSGALLVGALVVADHLRVPWPDQPGWERAHPGLADLRDRARRRPADPAAHTAGIDEERP